LDIPKRGKKINWQSIIFIMISENSVLENLKMKKLSVLFFAVVCALAGSLQCPRASQPTARQIRKGSAALDAKIKKESNDNVSIAQKKVTQLTKKMGADHPETRQAKDALERANDSHAALTAPAVHGYSVSSTKKQRDALRARLNPSTARSNSVPSMAVSDLDSSGLRPRSNSR